jgi:enoyl-CoA hydratase/carnithine racemase
MKYIKYEVDGHKATITLNRPDALNALSPGRSPRTAG